MIRISKYLNIPEQHFKEEGIFDQYLDIDSHFYVDPHLLINTDILEFSNSRRKIDKYFELVIALLKLSKSKRDLPWVAAYKKLIFPELKGVSIGVSKSSGNGNGIGPVLAERLTDRGVELINLGIDSPEIFEIIGLFVDDFGPDRLSDMTLRIIREELFSYTENKVKKLKITKTGTLKYKDKSYNLPLNPNGKSYLIFLPMSILSELPIAMDWEDISSIASFNSALRSKFNRMLAQAYMSAKSVNRLKVLGNFLIGEPEHLKKVVDAYKAYPAEHYDFEKDPLGMNIFENIAINAAKSNPLELKIKEEPKIEDLEEIVLKIIKQFGDSIELKGLYKDLYYLKNRERKIRHERYSQILFYVISDIYCKANNIDVTPEANGGIGPVDFKFSRGYELKYLVEIKYSTNRLRHGYEEQLKKYQMSENAKKSAYVIIQTSFSRRKINEVLSIEKLKLSKGENAPKVIVIDGRWKNTAST